MTGIDISLYTLLHMLHALTVYAVIVNVTMNFNTMLVTKIKSQIYDRMFYVYLVKVFAFIM